MADFLQTVKERVVVYDGAMGTNIQKRNPTLDDYWGKENCSEVLVLSRPDIIRDIHADFFRVGCDIVETEHFRRNRRRARRVRSARQSARDQRQGARNSRKKWRSNSRPKIKPRFVAGSMGPTTKLPSLGHIGFDAMVAVVRRAGCGADRGRGRCPADRNCAGFAAGQDRDDRRARGHAEGGQATAGAGAGHAAGIRDRCCWAPKSAPR